MRAIMGRLLGGRSISCSDNSLDAKIQRVQSNRKEYQMFMSGISKKPKVMIQILVFTRGHLRPVGKETEPILIDGVNPSVQIHNRFTNISAKGRSTNSMLEGIDKRMEHRSLCLLK